MPIYADGWSEMETADKTGRWVFILVLMERTGDASTHLDQASGEVHDDNTHDGAGTSTFWVRGVSAVCYFTAGEIT